MQSHRRHPASTSDSFRLRTALGLLLCALAATAGAETLVVTRNDDPAPNGCLPGDCSLREAVDAANANANVDVVQVPAGNYGLPRGKLTLTVSVQIYGDTDATTKVEGDGTFAVFDILGAIDVKLTHMTILGHGSPAIAAEPDANTILEFVSVPENNSPLDVGIPANSNGSLSVRASEIHSIIQCGSIRDCRVQDGSVIRRLNVGTGSATETQVSIIDSVIDGELAVGSSGAVLETNGEITIARSTITHASLGLQVLFGAPAQVTLDHLDYLANDLPVLITNAPVDVVDSLFSDNVSTDADGSPAAIHARVGSDWTISGSSFVGNVGNGAVGGALLVEDGATVRVRNSTFSGNSFAAASAAGARGAAIGFRSDVDITTLLLQHVTIVPPAFAPAGILGMALGGEGGESGLVLTVLNSIVRGSCSLDTNAMDVNFGNIESSGDSCDFAPGDNQVSVASASLALGALGANGGATPTYVPGPDSPAIDSADPAYCLATDQRGYPRPFGAGCDVGATELGADFLFADGFE